MLPTSTRRSPIKLTWALVACQLCVVGNATAQQVTVTEEAVRRVADGVLKDATFDFVDDRSASHYSSLADAPKDATLRPASAYNDWRYWNGVLNLAMLRLAAALGDSSYAHFASQNVAFGFDSYPYFAQRFNTQDKWSYPFGQRIVVAELDDYGAMGASVIEVYGRDPQPRYREYVEQAGAFALTEQGRLSDGTLVRSFPRKWTLWADDLFMSVPFLVRMGELTQDGRYLDDAARQVINYHRYLFDPAAGVMVHNWYSDIRKQGVAHWGRANGWAIVAQVELLDRLPPSSPLRATLLDLLRRHIDGIARYQSESGLWHQLLDKSDSYLETSASAMFVYAIARAVNRGYIDARYRSVAERGWRGVRSRIRDDGQIEGICAGTVVSDNLADYYQRPTPLNDVHGIGTVLLAGGEMLALMQKAQ